MDAPRMFLLACNLARDADTLELRLVATTFAMTINSLLPPNHAFRLSHENIALACQPLEVAPAGTAAAFIASLATESATGR